jgi:hypothetical protein
MTSALRVEAMAIWFVAMVTIARDHFISSVLIRP